MYLFYYHITLPFSSVQFIRLAAVNAEIVQ